VICRRPALVSTLVALLTATATACGDAGQLRAAGATPTAISPARLWPSLRPAASPAWPYDEVQIETVKGITAPGDDIHGVDPMAVVRAEVGAHPDDYTHSKAPYHETAVRLADCGRGKGPGEANGEETGKEKTGGKEEKGKKKERDPARCPVMRAYYRDLTGDGHDDMTLGFRLYPTNQTAVRVYTFEQHRLVQVFANDDAVTGVELAGRAVIIRSPAGIAGYEYRTTWSWDREQRAMVFSRDEYLRTGRHKRTHARTRPPAVSPSLTVLPAPSVFSSPAVSSSASTR
jgi:hypothetical protein